jgi:hypothetical protein
MMAAEGNAADSANASMSSAAVAVENIPVLADVIPADRYDPNDESMRSCRRYVVGIGYLSLSNAALCHIRLDRFASSANGSPLTSVRGSIPYRSTIH